MGKLIITFFTLFILLLFVVVIVIFKSFTGEKKDGSGNDPVMKTLFTISLLKIDREPQKIGHFSSVNDMSNLLD